MKKNWLNLMAVLKSILISTEIAYRLKIKKFKKKKKNVEERSSEFWNLEKRINSDNLIYTYKTEGRSLKDFRNYQNLIDLFKNLIDGNINPKKY